MKSRFSTWSTGKRVLLCICLAGLLVLSICLTVISIMYGYERAVQWLVKIAQEDMNGCIF